MMMYLYVIGRQTDIITLLKKLAGSEAEPSRRRSSHDIWLFPIYSNKKLP